MRSRSAALWIFAGLSAALASGYGVLFTIVADYRETYGISGTAIGWLIGVGFIAAFFSQTLVAPIADRGYARRVIVAGVAINIEMVASTCNFFYYIGLGYAFSTWGENFFLFFQNIAIVLLYFHFSRGLASGGAAIAVAAYAALGSALYLKAVPDVLLPAALVDGLGLGEGYAVVVLNPKKFKAFGDGRYGYRAGFSPSEMAALRPRADALRKEARRRGGPRRRGPDKRPG